MLNPSRDKIARHVPWRGEGRRARYVNPRSELRLEGSMSKKGEDNKWDGKITTKNRTPYVET